MTDHSLVETDVRFDFEKSDNNADPPSEEVAQEALPPAWTPPNGGYGWVCVACCFFINGHTWGVNSVRLFTIRNQEFVLNQGSLADFIASQVLRCLPRQLSSKQCLPRRNIPRLRLRRRPLHLSSHARLAHRHHGCWPIRHQSLSSDRRGPANLGPHRRLLRPRILAAAPVPRYLFRLWHGFPVCRLRRHNPTVVHHETLFGQRHWRRR